jgi:hypothetical protein
MQKRPNLFVGYKSAKAIPVRDPMVRDFLAQATLDPMIFAIDYQPTVVHADRVVAVNGIVLERCGGRYAADLVDARPPSDPQGEALLQVAFERGCAGIMEVTAADIRAEPRLSSAREVWSHGSVYIHGDDRARIVEALESEGPLEMAELERLADTRREVRAVVCALACEGSVELDLRFGLGPAATVRLGSRRPQLRMHGYGA